MAWVYVNEKFEECISEKEPIEKINWFMTLFCLIYETDNTYYKVKNPIKLPEGTIEKIIGRKLNKMQKREIKL